MDCKHCGKCCKLDVELVGGIDDIPDYMIEIENVLGHDILWMRKDENGDCVARVDGRCSIYAFRPLVCREFECGESRCSQCNGK